MGQLSRLQLQNLEKHAYSSHSSSMLDPIMQHWWNWLVQQCPLTLAPNLITIIGLAINIFTSLILVYYSPDAKQDVPRWACFLCAVGLFVYQSLDAIDGKQARRTNTSSPLGELFDHGCDSLSTVFVSLSISCAVRLGTYPYWMFCQCLMAVTLYYCAHWQTYVSGTLRFGYIDVTEAQFGVMLIHIVSAIFGCHIWSLKVFGTECTGLDIYVALGLFQWFAQMMFTYAPIILKGGAGKNGSTIAGTSVLSPLVPLCLVLIPTIIIAWKSPHNLFLNNPILYLLTFCCVMARITNRLVVAHMTKTEMNYTDTSLIGPAALFLNQYFNCPINENVLLWIVCVYTIYNLFKYCSQVCLEICEQLNIKLFTIVPKLSSSEKN